jgi:hypothetical protein
MSELQLSDDVIQQLEVIAARERRGIEEVLRTLIEQYGAKQPVTTAEDITPNPDPLVGLIGLLDDDIQATDLSTTVRETLKQYTHPQYGWTKRGRTD